MSRRRRRHRRSPLPWLRSRFAALLAQVAIHRRRAAVLGATGLVLVWLILTTTLPYALAERAPETALWLNPHQPVALLALANKARTAMLKLSNPRMGGIPTAGTSTDGAASGESPEAQTIAGEREALRSEIRSLAMRTIAVDPLNARAFRLLAEISEEAAVRPLMQAAFKRSRRESVAVFWLMNDSFQRHDYADVIAKADILFRTREQMSPHVMGFLGEIAAAPAGRQMLVSVLTKQPKWRSVFFQNLPRHVQRADTPLDLMLALKEAGNEPSMEELSPYLGFLVSRNVVDLAYNAWLQLMPQDKLTSLGLLNNASFTVNPSGLPFDWSVTRGQNTVVDFVTLRDGNGERALRIGFGVGRIRFPETSQVLVLGPGRYRLDGAFQGSMAARRGLRWEIRCMGAKASLAETDMIFGHPRAWQDFGFDIEVPDRADCRAQQLRLYHHARSPSEELISGEIFFRGLRLTRLGEG